MRIKTKTIGGVEYRVLGSTVDMERGRVVFKSYTVPGGKVTVENGIVTHPDGGTTDVFGNPTPTPTPTQPEP